MMFLTSGHFSVRFPHTRTWSYTTMMQRQQQETSVPIRPFVGKGGGSEPPVACSCCVSSVSFNLETLLSLSLASVTFAFQKTIRGMSLRLGVFDVCSQLCELCVFGGSSMK